MTIPRRIRVHQEVHAEHLCRKTTDAIEQMGAHPLLTEAVNLVGQAQSKIADFVDKDDPTQAEFIGFPKRVPSEQVGFTKNSPSFPGYLNVHRDGDNVIVTLREDNGDGTCGYTAGLNMSTDEWDNFLANLNG